MVCVVCGWWARAAPADRGGRARAEDVVCGGCARSLRRAGEVRLASGLLVRSLFAHEGPIRPAVHALKYRGADRVAEALAPGLAGLLPPDASALVPVPRALLRRMRYGVDAGRVIARALGRVARLPVADVLRTPVNHRSQLRKRRFEGLHFRSIAPAPCGAVLVDDVVTTGATLTAAASACGKGVTRAVTLTRSPVAGGGGRRPVTSG